MRYARPWFLLLRVCYWQKVIPAVDARSPVRLDHPQMSQHCMGLLGVIVEAVWVVARIGNHRLQIAFHGQKTFELHEDFDLVDHTR
jgi:hypothetical protein